MEQQSDELNVMQTAINNTLSTFIGAVIDYYKVEHKIDTDAQKLIDHIGIKKTVSKSKSSTSGSRSSTPAVESKQCTKIIEKSGKCCTKKAKPNTDFCSTHSIVSLNDIRGIASGKPITPKASGAKGAPKATVQKTLNGEEENKAKAALKKGLVSASKRAQIDVEPSPPPVVEELDNPSDELEEVVIEKLSNINNVSATPATSPSLATPKKSGNAALSLKEMMAARRLAMKQ